MGCSRQAVGGQSVGSRWAVGRRQPRQAAGGGGGCGGDDGWREDSDFPFQLPTPAADLSVQARLPSFQVGADFKNFRPEFQVLAT